MKVRTKMLATVIVVSTLLVALGVMVHHETRAFGSLKGAGTLIQRFRSDVLELRRNEKDFLARKDEKYLGKFIAKLAETQQTASSLNMLLDDLSIDSTGVADARTLIDGYGEQFKSLADLQVAIGLNERSGRYGKLREAVHNAESMFKDRAAGFEVQTQMLMLRRAEKDFMLRRNIKYLAKFDKSFSLLLDALNRSGLSDADRNTARGHMDRYRSEFRALVNAEQEIGLTPSSGQLGHVRDMVHAVEEQLATAGAVLEKRIVEDEHDLMLTLFSAIAGIIVLVGIWLSWMGLTIARRTTAAAAGMRQIAEGDGDLTRRLDESGGDEFAEMGAAFNIFSVKIHDILKKVAAMAASLGQTSAQVTAAATSTNDSMLQLRSNTQTVVVATEQMSTTARDVASSASQVSTSTQDADALAQEGRDTVEQSVQAINSFATEFGEAASTITALRAETENIGGILDVISGIAEQTNLLALNAAIEAARAGEQGRGFAVVADEVRTLAHRSRESTNEIQDLIARLQEQAESAVNKIHLGHERISETVNRAEQAGDALSRITESVAAISSMTTQIATAAEEQSAVVADISSNVVSIDGLATDTGKDADATTQLTLSLAEALSAVTREIGHFRFEDDEQLT